MVDFARIDKDIKRIEFLKIRGNHHELAFLSLLWLSGSFM